MNNLNDIKNEMVVCFLFTDNLYELLLQFKHKGPYPDTWNGFGGKVKEGELPLQAMNREMYEETRLLPEDLEFMELLVTLVYPNGVVLHVFYGVLLPDSNYTQIEDEPLHWMQVENRMLDANNSQFAGEGNIAFFIRFALNQIYARRTTNLL